MSQEVVSTTTLLASIAENERPDLPGADDGHRAGAEREQPKYFIIHMNEYGKGAAYIARVDDRVRVVHNGRPGKLYAAVDPYTLTMSPDGQHVAYGAKKGDKWVVVVDGREFGPFEDKGPPVFSPDSRHVAFEAKLDDAWHIIVDGEQSGAAVSYYDKPVFSGDSSRILRIENPGEDGDYRLVFTNLSFKNETARTTLSPVVVRSGDGSRLAAIEKVDGKQRVVEFGFDRPGAVKEGVLYDEVRDPVLNRDGTALAYLAKKGDASLLVLNGREERLPDGSYPWPPVIRWDKKGAGLIVETQQGAYMYSAFLGSGRKGAIYKECADLAFSRDGEQHAYVAIKNERFLIVVNGKEGPFFDRVVTPHFSPDGRFLVYRARQDGRRFVVVADADGKVLREYPRYERVFETTFTTDGRSVAYGVKEGREIIWKVEKLP